MHNNITEKKRTGSIRRTAVLITAVILLVCGISEAMPADEIINDDVRETIAETENDLSGASADTEYDLSGASADIEYDLSGAFEEVGYDLSETLADADYNMSEAAADPEYTEPAEYISDFRETEDITAEITDTDEGSTADPADEPAEGSTEETSEEPSEDSVTIDSALVTKAVSRDKCLVISWEAVPGASGYILQKRTAGSDVWTQITDTKGLEFSDPDVSSGTGYYYMVKAYVSTDDKTVTGENGNEKYAVYLDIPALVSAKAVVKGVKVIWENVSGATGYYIYRKTRVTDGYSLIGTSTGTSYIDKTAKAGTIYYYTVKAYESDDEGTFVSYFQKKALPGCFVPAPELSTLKNVRTGLKLTWKKVNGAVGYFVYRKAKGDTKWTRIKYVKAGSGTSYIDTSVKDSGIYSYRVCTAIKKGSKVYLSSFDGHINRYRLQRPSNIKVSSVTGGFKITWSSSDRASKYQVFRKIKGGSSWVSLGYTTGTAYTDKTANIYQQYYYTVVAWNNTGRSNFKSTLSPDVVDSITVNDGTAAAMVTKAQAYSSSTKWLILVNCTTNRAGVFYGSYGNWKLQYYWLCSTGTSATPTCKGIYSISSKGYCFSGSDYTCYYYSSFNGPYLLHSTLFWYGTFNDQDSRLGMNLSHGCVRLNISNAKWIYNNIPLGTRVVTY